LKRLLGLLLRLAAPDGTTLILAAASHTIAID
jgi:hypothetical protein